MADLDAVGQTALGVAWARAAESSRPDALFGDPLAEAIARVRPIPYAREDRPVDDVAQREVWFMYLWIVARTLFLDEIFADAGTAGIKQFVILGSGLDGRGFRLGFDSGATLFEVDRPPVVEIKEALVAESGLAATVDRRPVACDLRDDWLRALQDKGFRPDLPSAWLAEGLLVYLPDDVVNRVVEGVSAASEPNSRIGVTVRARRQPPAAEADPFAGVRALWHENPDIPALFDMAGWECARSDTRSVLARHGRELPDSDKPSTTSLLSGVRR